jgi:glutathione peroxidase
MKTILAITMLAMSAFIGTDSKSIHQFKVKTLEGQDFDFASLKGKKIMVVTLQVNVVLHLSTKN